MSLLNHLSDHARDERGAVLVLFTLFAPVAILFMSFALDAGNWYLHARHLQVQADAAALAAAQEFQPCTNASIYASAGQYGGASAVLTPGGTVLSRTPLYNEQVGATKQLNVHELINSKTFYGQASPVDATATDKAPCEADMVDVKETETSLPWYWRAFSSVPFINAHARVEILQEETAKAVEPLAVAETAPIAAKAYFVNEEKGDAVIAQQALTNVGTNAEGQEVWANSSSPLPVTINASHIGVVIALSGNKSDTTCGDALVECFDESSSTGPSLLHIQGWSAAGTGSYKAPIVRQVSLSPSTCGDAYFAAAGPGCTIGLSAAINLGAVPNPTGVKVNAIVGGTSNPLTYSTTTKLWSGSAALAKAGSNQVNIEVSCKPEKGSPCESEKKTTATTVENVQRAYAAGESSGPIEGAWVSEPAAHEAPVPQSRDADTYEVCEAQDANSCTHNLVVTVDVSGSLAVAAGYSDPLRKLRFEGEQGVRAGCPPPASQSGSQYRKELEEGCKGAYRINTADPKCAVNVSPYECLSIGLTGKDTGPTGQGISTRIESGTGTHFYCPNNWTNNNAGGVPLIPANDSRIVQLFVIPYGSVNAEGRSLLGNEEVPIQNFAAFYVTGFAGDSCKSDPTKVGNAEIVGHFIKYVNPLNNNGGGTKCVANSLGECVAVLTR